LSENIWKGGERNSRFSQQTLTILKFQDRELHQI